MELLMSRHKRSPIIRSSADAYLEAVAVNKYGTAYFTVPDGVTSICCICIGAGGVNSGGLAWRNNIPVTPGERLGFVINNMHSALLRGSDVPCEAGAGAQGGLGGKSINAINDGGGNAGARSATGVPGGAGGYTGNGGAGREGRYGPGDGGVGSGGGGGGGPILAGGVAGSGSGVGMWGQGASGASGQPGSGGHDIHYGRSSDGLGVVRILWGAYSFPTNAPKIAA